MPGRAACATESPRQRLRRHVATGATRGVRAATVVFRQPQQVEVQFAHRARPPLDGGCDVRFDAGEGARQRQRRRAYRTAKGRLPERQAQHRRRQGQSREVRIGRAPRPRGAAVSGRGSLSSNGRPGTRQGVRTPHLRAAMPVDASSLAVSCGGRGVSCDIWPASPSARAAPRAALSRTMTGSPRPARCVAPRPFAVRRSPGVARFRAMRLSRRRWFAPVRALLRTWRTVPRDASTADAAAPAAWHMIVTVR